MKPLRVKHSKINNDLFDVLMQLEQQRLQDGTLTGATYRQASEIEERKKMKFSQERRRNAQGVERFKRGQRGISGNC